MCALHAERTICFRSLISMNFPRLLNTSLAKQSIRTRLQKPFCSVSASHFLNMLCFKLRPHTTSTFKYLSRDSAFDEAILLHILNKVAFIWTSDSFLCTSSFLFCSTKDILSPSKARPSICFSRAIPNLRPFFSYAWARSTSSAKQSNTAYFNFHYFLAFIFILLVFK
jgi:hypothetical protein